MEWDQERRTRVGPTEHPDPDDTVIDRVGHPGHGMAVGIWGGVGGMSRVTGGDVTPPAAQQW